MSAYYNEIDEKAAAWLRELIRRGLIAPGDVDTRSILDVRPDDLRRYTQCHFFAGIGVWSYALRRAGWPDSRRVWTGSCPCQPFSAAGKGAGFADERHLWPAFFHLIEQCRPDEIFGEQVASKDGLAWLDLVHADMENTGYAFGAVDTCSAGFGAPHIRQRLYWVADATHANGRRGERGAQERIRPGKQWRWGSASGGADDGLGHTAGTRPQGIADRRGDVRGPRRETLERADSEFVGSMATANVGLAHADGGDTSTERQQRGGQQRQQQEDGRVGIMADTQGGIWGEFGDAPFAGRRGHPNGGGVDCWTGPTNGFWGDVDWLFCRDGKWRPVEPGTFPLAHGAPARVGRLRGYGNAINAEQAQGFIEAYLEKDVVDLRLTNSSALEADTAGQDIFG